ncbi:MAG: hypothetical protein GVY13_13335 [Alphaproteobacteria bacterium]|jgi:hypothetical protein|nr:hypothetical protein [Alphaproteobacteria bacterium]
MTVELKEKLVAFAKSASERAVACNSEEASKMFLVLPFVNSILGYDTKNPFEVSPEHPADFGEKWRNRVDYVIIKDGVPVACIECKKVGDELKDERGQLRGYFNAVRTIKLGVMTDGLRYLFFADAEEPNMMDEHPYITLDLNDVKNNKIEKSTLTELLKLIKSNFDPENIGSEAKKKAIFDGIIKQITEIYNNPTDDFVRMMLSATGLTHLRHKTLEQYRPLVGAAFKEFVDNQILTRLDISKKEAPRPEPEPVPEEPPMPIVDDKESKIITTELELEVYDYVKQRLGFLIRDEEAYKKIEEVMYRDFQTKFVIFFRKERSGRLLDVYERKEHKYTLYFPHSDEWVQSDVLDGIDEQLQGAFLAKIGELDGDKT